MKFFVPKAGNADQAEKVYQSIRSFNKGPFADRRIFAIDYTHNKKPNRAEVGQADTLTSDLVLAILESGQLYYVCTVTRGGCRGEPILVGRDDVTNLEDFDP